MDFVNILKRSFKITSRYRALWLFGFILALVGGGGGGGGSSSAGGGPEYSYNGGGNGGGIQGIEGVELSNFLPLIITIVVAAVAFIVLLVITLVVLQALARTALIGMVDEIEETEQTSVRSGFRILWSRQGLNLILLEMVVSIVWIIVAPAMVIASLLPGLLIITGNVVLVVAGVLAAIILLLITIAILTMAGAAFSIIMEIVRRECVLGGKGMVESIRDGIVIVRYHLADVGLMWVLMTGISIAWNILMIPVTIAAMILGLFIGSPPALVAYAFSRLWIPTAAIGLSLFVGMIVLLISCVQGLYLVFQSSVWTLTYREFQAQEMSSAVEELPPSLPEVEPIPA
ncbi:MAG: hypothetical protein SVX38_05625 [Chloroflexota bacterium]|nr:hypothetical protein [Chloroflexota bacterium]